MTLERVQTVCDNFFTGARREVSCVMKKFVYRVTFEIVAHFKTNFTFDLLIASFFVALPSMLFELVHCGHDDSLANWTKIVQDWKRTVDM